jgi:polyhydroxyalkanoate synthesis regulator phasin
VTTSEKSKKTASPGLVSRLADRGEEVVHRVVDEAAKRPAVSGAVERANAARERAEAASRGALERLGVAPVGEVEKLRKELARLERRVKKLEAQGKPPGA